MNMFDRRETKTVKDIVLESFESGIASLLKKNRNKDPLIVINKIIDKYCNYKINSQR